MGTDFVGLLTLDVMFRLRAPPTGPRVCRMFGGHSIGIRRGEWRGGFNRSIA